MNIVTIDFDIIMAPSIECYNRMIGPTNNCDVLEEINVLTKFFEADLHIYKILGKGTTIQKSQSLSK